MSDFLLYFSKAELQSACKELTLPYSGTKKVLADRLAKDERTELRFDMEIILGDPEDPSRYLKH